MAHAPDERSVEVLEPVIIELLEQSGAGQVLDPGPDRAIKSFPEGKSAYDEALAISGKEARNEQMARQILHGQVVPDILGVVAWYGSRGSFTGTRTRTTATEFPAGGSGSRRREPRLPYALVSFRRLEACQARCSV